MSDPLSARYHVDFRKPRAVYDVPGAAKAIFVLQEQREGWWGLFEHHKDTAANYGECVITDPPIAIERSAS